MERGVRELTESGEYVRSAMYWSVLALTTIGDLPMPRTKSEYSFLIMQLVFGLFLFASK